MMNSRIFNKNDNVSRRFRLRLLEISVKLRFLGGVKSTGNYSYGVVVVMF